MVQYDPFAPLLVTIDLPTRQKSTDSASGNTTPSLRDSPASVNSIEPIHICTAPSAIEDSTSKQNTHSSQVTTDDRHLVLHPQLRRLCSSNGSSHHYCSRCHMRRPSQELLFQRKFDQSPDEESWDGFCPDIAMPNRESPRPSSHHIRRHSGLCSVNLISQEQAEDGSPSSQILGKPTSCRHSPPDYHHACHCEEITPTDNISERYGMVEEPTEISIGRRRSMEKEAMDQIAEIMRQELLADIEAKQSRL